MPKLRPLISPQLSLQPPPFALALAQKRLASDLTGALANFTWINNVTLGAKHCRFAHDGQAHCLALHTALPFTAISVEGEDSATVGCLVRALLSSDQTAYALIPQRILQMLSAAVDILEIRPEWQMLYRGAATDLHPGRARLLREGDLAAMLALAAKDEVMVFGPDTFARGEFFGIYDGKELVCMGGVQNRLPGLVEIGSIITHPAHRRRGLATQVVSALVQHLTAQQLGIFLCLFQSNPIALALYEKLGFEIVNELYLVRFLAT